MESSEASGKRKPASSVRLQMSGIMGTLALKKRLRMRGASSTAEIASRSALSAEYGDSRTAAQKISQEREYELYQQLSEPLEDVSRQRLRAVKMGLRKYANVESRITAKELQTVFQDNQIKISSRTFQVIVDMFEDSFGIDYERMWRTLVTAQSRTGRDSVLAHNKRNDAPSNRPMMTQEEKDVDLVDRISKQLAQVPPKTYDLQEIRAELLHRDTNKASKLPRNTVLDIVTSKQLPIYGALVTVLLNRCDDEGKGMVSWPEIMSFLDRAQHRMEDPTGATTNGASTDTSRPATATAAAAAAKSRASSAVPAGSRATTAKGERGESGTLSRQGSSKRRRGVKSAKTSPAVTPNTVRKNDKGGGESDMETSKAVADGAASEATKENAGQSASKDERPVTARSEARSAAATPNMDQIKEETSKPGTAAPAAAAATTSTAAASSAKSDTLHPDRAEQSSSQDKPPIPASISKDIIKGAVKKTVKIEKELQPKDGRSDETDRANALAKARAHFFRKTDSSTTMTSVESLLENKKPGASKSSGFFGNMKHKLRAAKKRDGTDDDTDSGHAPLIGLDTSGGNSSMTEDAAISRETRNKKAGSAASRPARSSQSGRPGGQGEGQRRTVDINVRGRPLSMWMPDSYNGARINADPPQQRLKLEWVYGYRGNDCRSNLYVMATGEIIYFIGTVVVLLNREKHSQRHYREHTQEVRSIAVHANGITVASGQGVQKDETNIEGQALVRVWRCDTLQTLQVLGTEVFQRAVICLGFSRTLNKVRSSQGQSDIYNLQDRLCAVDCCEGHSLSVWDTSTGKMVAQTPLVVETMCDVGFNPLSADTIVTIGKEYLAWWRLFAEQSALQMQFKADYGTNMRARFVTAMYHTERGDLVTGDSNGTVYIWGKGGNTITNFIKHGHEGPVFALCLIRGTLMTGGRDGWVRAWVWCKNMDKSGEIRIPKHEGGVRILTLHRDQLLIGTTTNSVVMVQLAAQALRNPLAGASVNAISLIQGHFDSVYGVCAVNDPLHESWVVTAGIDGVISLVDTTCKRPLWKVMPKHMHATCVDMIVDDEGSLVVIATKDTIIPYEILTDDQDRIVAEEMSRFKMIHEGKLCFLKLSPDANWIAAGDTQGGVHFLQWRPDDEGNMHWTEAGTCKESHRGRISGLDWSSGVHGGSYIVRTSSEGIELFFWNPNTCSRIENPESLRNMRWSSSHCLFNYSVAGVWQSKQATEGGVTAIDVNSQSSLVVMGDPMGTISMFRHPCSKQGAYCHTYKAHPTIHRLLFTKDGQKIISIGGKDACPMQWTLI